MKNIIITTMLISSNAFAQLPALEELRYCGEPRRNKQGDIYRSQRVIAKFKEIHACPATGKNTGSCKGWAIDHVIPLACGGCDAVSNMQWLPNELKSAAKVGKDRFERVIYQKDIKCE
jgi:hypothetical protein